VGKTMGLNYCPTKPSLSGEGCYKNLPNLKLSQGEA